MYIDRPLHQKELTRAIEGSLHAVCGEMIANNQLEQLAIEWFQETRWECVNGADVAPEGAMPERANSQTVLLEARPAA